MALKIYGPAMSPCVARVMASLEEKGVEYELVPVDFSKGEHKQPQHLSRNPFGQTPAFQDGDLVLFESRAVSRYVARKYSGVGTDLLRDGSVDEAAIVDVWMEVESQQFNHAITTLVYEVVIAPMFGRSTDDAVVATNAAKLGAVLDVYEARLSKSKYLAGDFFSLADLHHLPYTVYLMVTPHASLVNSRPHVKAWWEDVSSRPACKKVAALMFAK